MIPTGPTFLLWSSQLRMFSVLLKKTILLEPNEQLSSGQPTESVNLKENLQWSRPDLRPAIVLVSSTNISQIIIQQSKRWTTKRQKTTVLKKYDKLRTNLRLNDQSFFITSTIDIQIRLLIRLRQFIIISRIYKTLDIKLSEGKLKQSTRLLTFNFRHN